MDSKAFSKKYSWLFLIPVIVNLIGQYTGNSAFTTVSKPILMPLLALTAWLVMTIGGVRGRRKTTIVLALLFGALGDILLMVHGTSWFLAGMLAFLVGHIFYYSTLPRPWKTRGFWETAFSLILLAALLIFVVSEVRKLFHVEGAMGWALTLYACAFAFLIHGCIMAAMIRRRPLFLLAALGFTIFAFSDVLVGLGVFTDIKIPKRGFIVMGTYILAQMLVSLSLAWELVDELKNTEYGRRLRRLYAIQDGLKAHESEFTEAFDKDFGKGEFETYTTETGYLYNSIRHTANHLWDWMQPAAAKTPFVLWPAKSLILSEPYGKVLIIGPFNYPLHLAVAPLAAALAAGNTAVVKPSRQTPHVSALIKSMLEESFPPEVVEVVDDSVSNEELLAKEYDYIFFTGSPKVGKIVMEAASKHLTPVTLELGGKSPAIVCPSADVRLACERIAKGKFLNAGQTCVAPDYVLVHGSIHDAFIKTMKEVVNDYFGDISSRPAGMTLMATRRHFDRVAGLIPADAEGAGRVVIGGNTDPSINYIAPTVIDNCSWEEPAMQEEIFGPVLPVLTYDDLQSEVIDKLHDSRPLSLYVFTRKCKEKKAILEGIRFGGGCVNETIMHLGNENMPFGGIGESGMGAYHGRTGFDTFSHKKSILYKSSWLTFDFLKPPYSNKLRLIRKIYK
ncbi:MAG: aldehyde dehydrogenase family protein [Bacteroidales bacterium]|nr:aldehyde dehydrogenase family protein [Bacteroidales bacterium]